MGTIFRCIAAVMLVASASMSLAAELHVGPGKAHATIEAAYAAAAGGDVILVHPLPDGRAYEKVALYLTKPVTIRGVGPERVKLSGKGFDYSGRGSTPRAMFQFNAGSDGSTLENFELSGAHNASHNGAGVRINQADRITVRNCAIHHNDMGAMSNSGEAGQAREQLFDRCVFHHNGDLSDPGYNHNLYLGGHSVTLRLCEVHSATTGHNVKSRAHITRLEYCHIHDSANRELDLVDAADTAAPGSDAFIIGCLIAKDPQCRGNRGVIHFGQDGGKARNGTLHVLNSTIVTPFISPVVELSAAGSRAQIAGNLIDRPSGTPMVTARGGARMSDVTIADNVDPSTLSGAAPRR